MFFLVINGGVLTILENTPLKGFPLSRAGWNRENAHSRSFHKNEIPKWGKHTYITPPLTPWRGGVKNVIYNLHFPKGHPHGEVYRLVWGRGSYKCKNGIDMSQVAFYNFCPPPKNSQHVTAQHKVLETKGGTGGGWKCNTRCWDILNGLLTFPPPPPRRNTKPIPLDPSPLKFPLRNSWGHGRLQIVSKQLYPFKTMLICIVCGGQHHLLQLAPQKKKDFTGLFLLFVYLTELIVLLGGERGKTWWNCWEITLPFQTMLICIVSGCQHHLLQLAPPPTTKDLKDFAGLFLLFVCFWEGNAVKHGEIVGKQLYFFKPMLICIVSWCQHHLLQLAPPTTKDLKDFTGNAVKHGEIVGKQL